MKFREWASKNGYTAGMIEEKTGIKARTIYSYFSGDRTPSRKREKLLKETLGIQDNLFD